MTQKTDDLESNTFISRIEINFVPFDSVDFFLPLEMIIFLTELNKCTQRWLHVDTYAKWQVIIWVCYYFNYRSPVIEPQYFLLGYEYA